MSKIKFLTKGDCIFLIIFLAYMIFSYFVSEFSILWLSINATIRVYTFGNLKMYKIDSSVIMILR